MDPSGISAASTSPIFSTVKAAPLGKQGRADAAGIETEPTPNSSTSACSAWVPFSSMDASTCMAQSSGASVLLRPGYPKKDTGVRLSTRIRCFKPASAASAGSGK